MEMNQWKYSKSYVSHLCEFVVVGVVSGRNQLCQILY